MIILVATMAAILFLLASAFYSGSEMGLYCLNRVRLRLQAEQQKTGPARFLQRLITRQDETVLAILLGTNLANYLLTVAFTTLISRAFGLATERIDLYAAAILSPMIFVFGDVVPKNWYQMDAERLMYRSVPILKVTVAAFRYTGVLWMLHQFTRLSVRLTGHGERGELRGQRAEVIGLLREGAAEGALTEEQAEIVERVMNFSSIRVGAIMIPRRRVATVPIDADRVMFKRIVASHDYSRMPVIGRNRRSIVGIVNVYDVLADETNAGIEAWLQEATSILASDPASSALIQLQQSHASLAIVTDPRRGFVGVITLKDVVEEIFGELPAW